MYWVVGENTSWGGGKRGDPWTDDPPPFPSSLPLPQYDIIYEMREVNENSSTPNCGVCRFTYLGDRIPHVFLPQLLVLKVNRSNLANRVHDYSALTCSHNEWFYLFQLPFINCSMLIFCLHLMTKRTNNLTSQLILLSLIIGFLGQFRKMSSQFNHQLILFGTKLNAIWKGSFDFVLRLVKCTFTLFDLTK